LTESILGRKTAKSLTDIFVRQFLKSQIDIFEGQFIWHFKKENHLDVVKNFSPSYYVHTLQTHPCNKNRDFPVYFSQQGNSVLITLEPCNENKFFPVWGKVHRENPVLALYWPCTGLQCSLIETNNQVFCCSCPLAAESLLLLLSYSGECWVGPFLYTVALSHIWEHEFYYLEGMCSKGSKAVIKYLTMAWIQISCQNLNGFFSNDSHQIII
jgi:hypothetical protein